MDSTAVSPSPCSDERLSLRDSLVIARIDDQVPVDERVGKVLAYFYVKYRRRRLPRIVAAERAIATTHAALGVTEPLEAWGPDTIMALDMQLTGPSGGEPVGYVGYTYAVQCGGRRGWVDGEFFDVAEVFGNEVAKTFQTRPIAQMASITDTATHIVVTAQRERGRCEARPSSRRSTRRVGSKSSSSSGDDPPGEPARHSLLASRGQS